MSEADNVVDIESEWSLVDLLRGQGDTERDVYIGALMVCADCEHRIIDHDQVAFSCLLCGCDQSDRGLVSYGDKQLADLQHALSVLRRENVKDAMDADRPAGDQPMFPGLRDLLHEIQSSDERTGLVIVDIVRAAATLAPLLARTENDRGRALHQSPAVHSILHSPQSINGCVTCERKWYEHTSEERGERLGCEDQR